MTLLSVVKNENKKVVLVVVTKSDQSNSETYTVNNLKPDTSYIFLVRAENSHGMSPPRSGHEFNFCLFPFL